MAVESRYRRCDHRPDTEYMCCKPRIIFAIVVQLKVSAALTHFTFGAGMTTLLITFLIPNIRYPRTFLLAGGGWAMLPDLHWVSPIFTHQLHTFHQHSLWTDLFWLHRTLDRADPTDSNTIAAILLAFFILTTMIAEHRSYRTPNLVKATYDSLPIGESSE